MNVAELREKEEGELHNLCEDLDKETFAMRNELATAHKIENPHMIRENRRTKARILTILEERKRGTHGKE